MKPLRSAIPIASGLALLATSCNMFSFIDSPSGDAQLKSAARACFDRGDMECALEHYQKLSSSESDVIASETAYTLLDQEGASMGAFMEFVGNGADGAALTTFAERLMDGAGKTRRMAIYTAYKKHTEISAENTSLKAFVKFIGALSLAAEILAEAGGADGSLTISDLVSNASTCSANLTSCSTESACGAPAGGLLPSSPAFDDIETTEPNTDAPNLDQLYWAIKYAYEAATALSANGKFAGTQTGLSEIFNVGRPSTAAPIDQCFRAQLIDFGIGGT